jgi:hypothetical protein
MPIVKSATQQANRGVLCLFVLDIHPDSDHSTEAESCIRQLWCDKPWQLLEEGAIIWALIDHHLPHSTTPPHHGQCVAHQKT